VRKAYKAKVCIGCAKEFKPTTGNAKYCDECRALGVGEKHYRAARKEQTAAHDKIYREKNRKAIAAQKKESQVTNKAKIAEQKKRSYNKHKTDDVWKEKMYARTNGWAKRNPEGHRLRSIKRRALTYDNTPITELLTEAQWRDILDQYHHRCAYCGKKSEHLTVDHLVPLIKGGKHSASNVVPACKHCNCSKGIRSSEERFGITVKQ
jgi:5-methylcytosine-specific restriction endonuclease McrA